MVQTTVLSKSDVTNKAVVLQKYWNERKTRFKDWYEQIQMIDKLAQRDMESFVGNDPRAAYNLILSILDQPIPHRILPQHLQQSEIRPAADLSFMLESMWDNVYDGYRRRGRYWKRDLISFLLATGWFSVFAIIPPDGSTCLAEIWNPATVFPAWDDVLIECAHIFTLTEAQARRMAFRNKWNVPRFSDKNVCYDYWFLDDAGKVHNAIVLAEELVKPDTAELHFNRIPIFVSPVGGLPDTGEIAGGKSTTWRGEVGQSVIATNEFIYKTFNRWWTFLLQLLRDTAQPRTYEKSGGTNKIVKPEDWFKRGAHFKVGPNEDLGYLTPPAIPVELRAAQLDLEAAMQRGGPVWSQYGNISQGMTAYVMSQIVASTNNTASPYHQAVQDCVGDIDNFWIYLMQEHGYKPYELSLPPDLPEKFKVVADYELRIPGDLAQRATSARMLNPEFSISEERIMEWSFPEIKNPSEELARREAGAARRDPIFAQLSLVSALKQEANILRAAKDSDSARLFEAAAKVKEQQILSAGQPQQAAGAATPSVRARPEVVPPRGSAPPMTTTGEGR